jgi:hypothetical protein
MSKIRVDVAYNNQKSFASFFRKRKIFFLERKKQRTFIIIAWTAG